MTGLQLAVARALLRLSRPQLAELIGEVSERTLANLEAERPRHKPVAATVTAVERYLAAEGISFDPDGVNVRMAVKAKRR